MPVFNVRYEYRITEWGGVYSGTRAVLACDLQDAVDETMRGVRCLGGRSLLYEIYVATEQDSSVLPAMLTCEYKEGVMVQN